ncbi:homing endonuclease associated repeat-containing protein [Halocalculus aciditolerans]|uniref:Uncharacterized protein n=1 Tax=Halocalculus aciditolerans TaxID=1383812 RepID=A0A830F5R3_9EURY|nr:hypothetical protein [Halocalculus aciditolerans]GGL65774.1 hypothetical protein GCM10009039_24590 [Halocalculus aciditolerans]
MNLLSTYMRSRGDYSPSLLNRTGPGGVRADAGLCDRPLHEYLDEDELPHYVLEASSAPAIERAGERVEHTTGNYATFVVATDDRVLCVAGGPDGDAVITIPYSELTAVDAETRRKMVSKTAEVTVRGEHASITFETDQRNTVPAVRAYVGEQIAEHYLDEAFEQREASRERREERDLERAEVDLTDASYAVTQVLELAPNGSAVRERAEELSADLEADAHRLSRAKAAAEHLEETDAALDKVHEAVRAGEYESIPAFHDEAEAALEDAMDKLDPADAFTKTVASERETLREQQAQLVGVDDFEGLLGTLEDAREAHDRYEVAMDDGDLDAALDALQGARDHYAEYVNMLPQAAEPTDEGCVRCDDRPAAFDIETPDGHESVCLPCTAFGDDGALPRGEEITQRLAALPDVDALPEAMPDEPADAERPTEAEEPAVDAESASTVESEPAVDAERGGEAESSSEPDAVEESPWSEEEAAMLDELRDLQDGRGELLRAHDLRDQGAYSAQDYIATFGSWDDALAAADVDKEARLLGELQRVTDALGHLPSKLEMSRHGQYSANMYERFFGEWDAARDRLNEWHTARTSADEPSAEEESTAEPEPTAEPATDAEPTSASAAEPTTEVEIETAEPESAEISVEEEPVHPEPSGARPSTDAPAEDSVPIDVADEPDPVSDGGTTAATAEETDAASESETADAEADDGEDAAKRERMIDELRALKEEKAAVPSRDDVVVGGSESLLSYEVVFGSLEDALDEAGIDRGELFADDIASVGEELGTLPSRQQFARYGEHGISQVVEFFGSWDEALDAAFGESN